MEPDLKEFEKHMNSPEEEVKDYPISRKSVINIIQTMISVSMQRCEWKVGGALTSLRDLLMELQDVSENDN